MADSPDDVPESGVLEGASRDISDEPPVPTDDSSAGGSPKTESMTEGSPTKTESITDGSISGDIDVELSAGSPSDYLLETVVAAEVQQFFGISASPGTERRDSMACSSASVSSQAQGACVIGAASGSSGTSSSSSCMPMSSSSSSRESASSSSHNPSAQTAYEVNIKCIDGTTTKLEITSSMSGLGLKELICQNMSVPVERQRLISRGRVIQDTDLVGQHITASGQTIHLVQRPVPPPGSENQASRDSARSADQAPQEGPQIRIQQVGGMLQGGAGEVPVQAELSELLGAMLGTVGRGVGMGAVLHATPMMRMPRPGAPAPAPSTTAPGGSTNSAAPAPPLGHSIGGGMTAAPLSSILLPGSSAPRRGCWSKESLFIALFVTFLVVAMPMMAWCIVQIETTYSVGFPPWHIWALGFHLLGLVLGLPSVYLALRSRSPLRGLRALLSQPDGSVLDSNQTVLTQAIAAMALQPQQMVFSQGLGIGSASVNVMASVPEDMEATDGVAPSHPEDLQGHSANVDTFPWGVLAPEGQQNPNQGLQNPALPWQDLSGLNDEVRRLLGRPAVGRSLPPNQMPHGEMYAFLSTLQTATSQLGVGIGDLQASLLDEGANPEQLQSFALALETAARALSSTAAAVRGGFDHSRGRQAVFANEANQQGEQAASLAGHSIFINATLPSAPQVINSSPPA